MHYIYIIYIICIISCLMLTPAEPAFATSWELANSRGDFFYFLK
jgi:hypothetical protein